VPCIPSGFPPLAAAGGQTVRSGGQTVPGIEAGGQTASPEDQTTLGTKAGGQTTHGTEAGGSIA
jgi:hypothetical protein